MKKLRGLYNDEWARIPFSVIGVFLIIGSSITSAYITQLEKEKAKEISLTIEMNNIEPVVRYVEADLARCLNYAACKAFEKIGKNPVVKPAEGTIFYFDVTKNNKIDGTDINLNWVRFETYNNLKKMINENFQNGRYTQGDYKVEVTMPSSWMDISLEDVLDLYLSRAVDNIVQNCRDKYPVYPVLGINMSLSVYDLNRDETVYEKKSVIMTIITSRYLLLENLTNEFDYRINESFGPLGVNCLSYLMLLTWVHAWTQSFTDKPLNIISTKWLETATNTGILLEEGFVFNSVDPLGVVYTGYETVRAIAEDLSKRLSDDELKGYLTEQVSNPMGTNDFKERQDQIMNDMGVTPLSDDQLKFDMDANISVICKEAYDWITGDPEGRTVMSVINVYSAELYTKVSRETMSDNEESIEDAQNALFDSSKDDENDRYGEANKIAQDIANGNGWYLIGVKIKDIHGEKKIGRYPSIGSWSLDTASYRGAFSFDNSKIPVILSGEKWIIDRVRIYTYEWQTWSKWTATLSDGNNTLYVDFDLPKKSYSFSYTHRQSQWVNITFESNNFSKLDSTKNDIMNPFRETPFEDRTDPNLYRVYKLSPPLTNWSIIDRYKIDINWPSNTNWNVEPRNIILLDTTGIINNYNKKYPKEINPENYKYEYTLYPSWIYKEIDDAVSYWRDRIPREVKTTEEVNQDTAASVDELEREIDSTLYGIFVSKRAGWEREIASKYKTGSFYKSAAAKVLYKNVMRYFEKINSILTKVGGEDSIKRSIDEALDKKTNYDNMKKNMQDAKNLFDSLGSMPRFPLAFILNLNRPPGNKPYHGWTERFQCAVVQKPSFFSKENYEKYYTDPSHVDEEKCKLKYQNINIFSPGAGISKLLIDRGFDAVNKMVCNALDMGFDSLETELMKQNETMRRQVKQALDNITDRIYNDLVANLSRNITNRLIKSAVIKHLNINVTCLEVDEIVVGVLHDSRYSGGMNNPRFASDLNTSKLVHDITIRLQDKINNEYNYLSGEIKQMVMDVVDEQVLSVYTEVVSKTIDKSKELLKKEYGLLSSKLQKWANDQVSELVSSFIPAGLFLLPYIGWVCTLNAWYIDVSGQIPFFQVVDTFDETTAHPFWGHTAQEYTRRFSEVKIDTDEDGEPDLTIGYNKPVDFEYKTATLAIVPPGKQTGMGDRIGGWEELSKYP